MTATEERDFWNERKRNAVDISDFSDQYLFDPTQNVEATFQQIIDPIPDNVSSILEIGCGIGRMTELIAFEYPEARVVGIDVSDEMVEYATDNLDALAHYVVCDGRTIPAPNESFEAIVSLLCFQHIPLEGLKRYFTEAERVLVDDGILVFQICEDVEEGPITFNHHSEQLADELQEVGFETVLVQPHKVMKEWTWLTALK